jgi:kynurenine 3-monooxygenase
MLIVIQVNLKPESIYSWRMDNGTNLLLLYQLDGSLSGVINFPANKN